MSTPLITLLQREGLALYEAELNGDALMNYRKYIYENPIDTDSIRKHREEICEEFITKRDKALVELNEIRHQIKEYLEMLSNY